MTATVLDVPWDEVVVVIDVPWGKMAIHEEDRSEELRVEVMAWLSAQDPGADDDFAAAPDGYLYVHAGLCPLAETLDGVEVWVFSFLPVALDEELYQRAMNI